MNENWEKAIAFVLEMEGGYTNDPNDAGGETNFGICKRDYPSLDIKNLSIEKAKAIYQKEYWQACQCDSLPWPVDLCVFDTAVNEGAGEATRILQILLGVKADGIIGDNTITAAFKNPPSAKRYLTSRLSAYARVILAHPNDIVFADNWHNRVLSLFEEVQH